MEDIIKGLQQAAREGEERGRREQVKSIVLAFKYGRNITGEDVTTLRAWLACNPTQDELLDCVNRYFNL